MLYLSYSLSLYLFKCREMIKRLPRKRVTVSIITIKKLISLSLNLKIINFVHKRPWDFSYLWVKKLKKKKSYKGIVSFNVPLSGHKNCNVVFQLH